MWKHLLFEPSDIVLMCLRFDRVSNKKNILNRLVYLKCVVSPFFTPLDIASPFGTLVKSTFYYTAVLHRHNHYIIIWQIILLQIPYLLWNPHGVEYFNFLIVTHVFVNIRTSLDILLLIFTLLTLRYFWNEIFFTYLCYYCMFLFLMALNASVIFHFTFLLHLDLFMFNYINCLLFLASDVIIYISMAMCTFVVRISCTGN